MAGSAQTFAGMAKRRASKKKANEIKDIINFTICDQEVAVKALVEIILAKMTPSHKD